MTIFTKNIITGAALFVPFFISTSAFSATYNFDAIYDGTNISSVGVDNPIGTALQAGDSFNYNVHAAGDDFWSVDVTDNYFPFLAFTIDEAGDRTGDMSLSLYLDGVLQLPTLVENGIVNSEVHLGTNGVSLDAGLVFDEIVLDYLLISSFDTEPTPSANSATIAALTIGPNIPGGFGDGISYSAVPVPAALWLFGSGLISLIGVARSKARA